MYGVPVKQGARAKRSEWRRGAIVAYKKADECGAGRAREVRVPV